MNKLYLFTNTKGNGYSGWEECIAMADDGTILGSHLCSSVNFMYGDLFANRPDRQKTYEKHFGGKASESYEVVELDPGNLPPQEVLDKNQKAGVSEEASLAGVKVEITTD